MVDIGVVDSRDRINDGVAINAYGQVAVESFGDLGGLSGLWTPDAANASTGTMSNLGVLDSRVIPCTSVVAVDVDGRVVGGSGIYGGGRAFIWEPTVPNGPAGTMHEITGFPDNPTYTAAADINGLGLIVGTMIVQTPTSISYRAYVWTPTAPYSTTGTVLFLDGLFQPGDVNIGNSINNRGDVVGDFGPGPFQTRAFLWSPNMPNGSASIMVDLGTLPGTPYSRAQDINARGQIIGVATNFWRYFSAIPLDSGCTKRHDWINGERK
jgi:probable HAF family extracellular repeat protein